MIRLLEKLQINKIKTAERKLEIDEGVKLAKNIDALREIRANEETSLENFRRQTVTAIYSEINEANNKLAIVKEELKIAEAKRDGALEPLNEEWNKVEAAKITAIKLLEETNIKLNEVEERNTEVQKYKQEVSDTLARVKTQEQLILTKQQNIEKAKEEANRLRQEASEIHIQARATLSKAEGDIQEKERILTLRTNTLEEKEKDLAKRDKENQVERKQLADMRRTLETELKRLKK